MVLPAEVPHGKSTGWTFETLHAALVDFVSQKDIAMRELVNGNDRRYLQMFTSSQEAVAAALSAAQTQSVLALNAAEKAVSKAEFAAEKRFEGVNEFRNTLADQQRTLMPRTESEFRASANEARIAAVERQIANLSGSKIGSKDTWGWVIGLAGIILAFLAYYSK